MTILIIWWFVGAPIYQYNCQSLSLFQILPLYILNDCHKMYVITHRFFIHLIHLPRIVTFLFEIYSLLKFMYERLQCICLQSTVTLFLGLCKKFSFEQCCKTFKLRPNTRSFNISLRTTNDQQLCLFWSHRQGKRWISANEVSRLIVHTVLIGLLDKENTTIGTFFSHTNIYESNKKESLFPFLSVLCSFLNPLWFLCLLTFLPKMKILNIG